MTWVEAMASLQLEAELRVGAIARARVAAVQAQVDASNDAADAALRSMIE